MNPGTVTGRSATIVGDRCFFLANSHVGHDSIIGNDCVFSNNVMIAGHVTVDDFVICGGGSAIVQYARVGAHSFVSGMTGIGADLIPFGLAFGSRGFLMGLNLVGLKRRNFGREAIHDLRRAYRALFAPEGTLKERVEDVAEEFADNAEVDDDRRIHPRRRRPRLVHARTGAASRRERPGRPDLRRRRSFPSSRPAPRGSAGSRFSSSA